MRKNTDRIIKNVGVLYLRMILMSIITLYSSRIILSRLGVDGYGVFMLINGFITITAFFQASMAISVQRNISYELGAGSIESVREIFATCCTIYIGLAFLIIIIGSTIGFYLFRKYINIPPSLDFQAQVLYFTTLSTFIMQVLSIPNVACFIAHENLTITSCTDIVITSLNLMAAISLSILPHECRLIGYGIMILCIYIGALLFYIYRGYSTYEECRRFIPKCKNFYSKILKHAFWNVVPSISTTLKLQGSPILLNLFFGTIANSSYGIANQVNGAFSQFMYTITRAVNPQIFIKYAAKEYDELNSLIRWAVKIIFIVLFTIAIPLFSEIDYILKLWLITPPKDAAILIKIFIFIVMVDSLSNPLMTLMQATGKISLYLSSIALIQLLILPISYALYKFFNTPIETVLYVSLGASVCNFLIRSFFASKFGRFELKEYLSNVLIRIIFVIIIEILINKYILYNIHEEFLRLVAVCSFSVISMPMLGFFVLFTQEDKIAFIDLLKKLVSKVTIYKNET